MFVCQPLLVFSQGLNYIYSLHPTIPFQGTALAGKLKNRLA